MSAINAASKAFYSEEDERGILGCVLKGSPQTVSDIAAAVPASWLTHPDVHDSYETALELLADNQPRTRAPMGRAWARRYGDRPIPQELWDAASKLVPTNGSNWDWWKQGVEEASKRRAIQAAGLKLAHDIGDPTKPISEAVTQLETFVVQNTTTTRPASVSSREVLKSQLDQMKAAAERRKNGKLSGIPTGLWKLDKLTDGFQAGEMAIIGARPSMGKTVLGCNFAREAALNQGVPTLFVSAEMSDEALMRRIAADVATIPLNVLKSGTLSDAEWKRYAVAQDRIAAAPLHFHSVVGGGSVGEVVASIRSNVRKYGIRLIVVDYLQKLRADGRHEKKTYEVAEVSGALKACAVQLNVALVVLAQINRDSEKDREKPRIPGLVDLAESGQIERDGDMIALIHRDRFDAKVQPLLIVAKQRDGECGFVRLAFDGSHQRFTDQGPDIRPEDCEP